MESLKRATVPSYQESNGAHMLVINRLSQQLKRQQNSNNNLKVLGQQQSIVGRIRTRVCDTETNANRDELTYSLHSAA